MSSSEEAMPDAAAILLAAGRSTRMGTAGGPRKPFLQLGGKSLIERGAEAFDACARVGALVLVAHREDVEHVEQLARRSPALRKTIAVVPGGAERTDSVRAGMEAVPCGTPLVAIHDSARPLVRAELVERCLAAADESGAALVALPAADTVKESDDGRSSARTLDRARLWLAQTPQAFRTEPYRALLERAREEGFTPTDDAALHERYVGPVSLVRGEAANLKVTRPEDLALAESLLAAREPPAAPRAPLLRVGTGFDLHRLVPGRPCVLGGIRLEHPSGPLGHSDGDAVLHAIADAVLGAAGADDLGTLFRDDDPRWKDCDSAKLLVAAVDEARARGWSVQNVDVVIATEGPRIAPVRAAMRARLGELLGLQPDAVNVKGKSLEGMGALAGGTGVAVQAVCLLQGSPR